MVTADTVKKCWENAVLAKYTANYWLTYDRNGKHATNCNKMPVKMKIMYLNLHKLTL